MNMPQAVIGTEIVSAFTRIIPALICFDTSIKLAPNRANYANAPKLFRVAVWLSGLFIMTSMADLIDRALTTFPPHPLLTGYTTTFSELFVAIAGHVWLQTTWKPVAVRERLNRRSEVWERLAPCTRREQIIKERRRNFIPAEVAVGPMGRPPTFAEVVSALDDEGFAPISDGVEDVIPPVLKR